MHKSTMIESTSTPFQSTSNHKNTSILQMYLLLSLLLLLQRVESFITPTPSSRTLPASLINTPQSSPSSSTALSVWWFGGTPTQSETLNGEECELVAVRIDRTSPNSRRISGEIVVDAPLLDVWAILTDYDNLSTHVPNLVSSKRLKSGSPTGHNGDGSYECRLYQRGAQKIIGFEFGADVTMDMREEIVVAGKRGDITKSHEYDVDNTHSSELFDEERMIHFKCVDSQFFSEFDGTWSVRQSHNVYSGVETTVSYCVEVRPKGPVPVAALEWRIREDVPTNLRAVKRAALEVGWAGVHENGGRRVVKRSKRGQDGRVEEGFADFILDYENETLGAYLE